MRKLPNKRNDILVIVMVKQRIGKMKKRREGGAMEE